MIKSKVTDTRTKDEINFPRLMIRKGGGAVRLFNSRHTSFVVDPGETSATIGAYTSSNIDNYEDLPVGVEVTLSNNYGDSK